MARVGRVAGALLVESQGVRHRVGDFKEPFRATIDDAPLAAPWLVLDVEGDALLRLLERRLVIERTGLVSERLWRLITHEQGGDAIDARWLGAMPDHVWDVVRESILRCS